MSRTRIKICGLKTPEDALWAVECGADALGFVFVESSPRFIEPERAWDLVSYLPPFVSSVGLVADTKPGVFSSLAERCPCDCFQLHGRETPDDARALAAVAGGVIKALRFDAETVEADLRRWADAESVEALLMDGSTGGQGTALDWAALAPHVVGMHHPLILAGGLTPENVGEAIATVQPYAVDVSSGVERRRGEKDSDLIAAFCEAVRAADAP